MKKSIFVVLTLLIIGSQSQTILAQEKSGEEEIEMKQTVAVFDLHNLENSQSVTIYTESGGRAQVTIEKSSLPSDEGSILKAIANNTYIISYTSLIEKISYEIDVRNNSIVSAHSGSYTVIGYSVNSSQLKIINSKQASYIFECSFLLKGWTNRLNARINNSNQLEVQFNK